MLVEMEAYIILDKKVGETPLSCVEEYRSHHAELAGVPLAYAGRLDPMASGALLVLIGDTCKRQKEFHGLEKEYSFSVLFGVSSDTGDVLGRLQSGEHVHPTNDALRAVAHDMSGKTVTFPYPAFSSKTVHGKPLHMWSCENKLHEIEIPSYTAAIHSLTYEGKITMTGNEVAQHALQKINTIPPVTDERKALGNDFRRGDIRQDWAKWNESHKDHIFTIATFTCHAGSGAYMRTLSETIAKQLGTSGLAWHIHRNKIFGV